MSKQWFYEVMGSPVGPITSQELKACVVARKILPETQIRLGTDGKWQTADRVKGLFDPPPPATSPPAAKPAAPIAKAPSPAPAKAPSPPKASTGDPGTAEIKLSDTSEFKLPVSDVKPALESPRIAIAGAESPKEEEDSGEYDFFKFVGFENAIGHELNKVLVEYCRVHHATMSQVTKRALAEFLGRKDLSGDKASSPPAAPPPVESFGVG